MALLETESAAAAPPVVNEGRSRRVAATKAEAAIAHTAAFETSRQGSMSPPVAKEQAAVLRMFEKAAKDTARAVNKSAVPVAAPAAPAADVPLSPSSRVKRKVPERSNSPVAQAVSKRGRGASNGPLVGVLEAAAKTPLQSGLDSFPLEAEGTERSKRTHKPSVRLMEIHQPPKPQERKHHSGPKAPRPISGGFGSAAALQPTMFLANGHKPETAEQAGSDIPSLIAMAGSCQDLDSVVDQMDIRLPAYKGNNIHARLLRMAYSDLRLGHFALRKQAVSLMAKKLWLLAGKLGDKASREAAATVGIDHLPEHLKAYGATDATPGPSQAAFSADESVEKYFAPPPVLLSPRTALAAAAGGGGGALTGSGGYGGYSSGNAFGSIPTSGYKPRTSNFVPPIVDLSKYDERLVKLAELGRAMLHMRRGEGVKLQQVLKTQLLVGRNVRYQHRNGRIMNNGVVSERGLIICHCENCKGQKEVTPTDFEIHAGSGDRRPADSIYFDDIQHTFRDLLTVMTCDAVANADVHMDYCLTCRLGGELVCCDGCTAAYHKECAGLPNVPEGQWHCGACVAEYNRRLTAGSSRGRGGSGRSRGRGSSTGKVQGRGRGRPSGSGGGAGRVHMMAPSAQRRVSRPFRNLNRNKRLFEGVEGGLKHGDHVHYITRGATVLSGTAFIDPTGQSGILCNCCSKVVSCSQFEAHAGHSQRRQPYECIYTDDGRNLKTIAAALPALPEEPEIGASDGDGADDGDGEPGQGTGGCVLCHDPEFQRGEFGARTMMLCDQCEREFHVGCMTAHGIGTLEAIPEGDWFCSAACGKIHGLLKAHVAAGQIPVIFDDNGMPRSNLSDVGLAPPAVVLDATAIINAAGDVSVFSPVEGSGEGDGAGLGVVLESTEVAEGNSEEDEDEEDSLNAAGDGELPSEERPQKKAKVTLPTPDKIAAAAAAAVAQLAAGLAAGTVPREEDMVDARKSEEEDVGEAAAGDGESEPTAAAAVARGGEGKRSRLQDDVGVEDAGNAVENAPLDMIIDGATTSAPPLGALATVPENSLAEASGALLGAAGPSTAPSLPMSTSAAALNAAGYTWQILNGKDQKINTTYSIKAAAEILQESFDPIIDLSTNTDLLPLMLHARQYGDWDYKGVYTLLLRYKNKPVVAATSRVFGPQYAELPLIATRSNARRQGHARVLVSLFLDLLQQAGVHTLVLPAAHETVDTWKNGFGFIDMPEEEVAMAKQQLRILVFPGTEVLWKKVYGTEEPRGHHILQPLPSYDDVIAVRATLQDLVRCVAIEAGEEEGPAPLFNAGEESRPDGDGDPPPPPATATAAALEGGQAPPLLPPGEAAVLLLDSIKQDLIGHQNDSIKDPVAALGHHSTAAAMVVVASAAHDLEKQQQQGDESLVVEKPQITPVDTSELSELSPVDIDGPSLQRKLE